MHKFFRLPFGVVRIGGMPTLIILTGMSANAEKCMKVLRKEVVMDFVFRPKDGVHRNFEC